MDVSNVSESSMHKEGLKLISDLWDELEFFRQDMIDLRHGDAVRVRDVLILAVHRLTFLELVTKGLTYMEMHDAQAYAKFVHSKRKIEDLDIEELRVLLR